MKNLTVLLAALFTVSAAQAGNVPELYCVSTKGFNQTINQINIFTNKSGTLRLSLQYWTTDGQEIGSFDTDTLETVRSLKYNETTGELSNSVNKIKLVVEKTSITPAEAQALIVNEGFEDVLNPSGHKLDFKQYYKAQVTEYNLDGPRGSWKKRLKQAHKAGVKDYVCGNSVDIIGRRAGLFDGMFEGEIDE